MALPSTPGVALPASLEAARIDGLPASAYYIPNFISVDEEQLILDKVRYPPSRQELKPPSCPVCSPFVLIRKEGQKIAAAPKPRWKQLTHRRLQTWPSDLVRDKLLDAVLPPWLESPVVPRLQSMPVSSGDTAAHLFSGSPHTRPNHVLINEYPPGDGGAYWPVVCTVSLGASLCLNLHRSKEDGALDPKPAWRILQEPRSLLITTDELYTDHLHGIADIEEDVDLSQETVANWSLLGDPSVFADGRNVRQTRTSLTYRDVLQVSKAASKIGLFMKR
ncbi:Alkbh6 protein [Cordyceps militaris CM01]|uniref:Alkbh6 protein n=1 Tax=Cordyceps militaris (strain CM01) TaxID=983644 RepID=G3J7G4_CORMM|nr:Alkbh6 protein [Cordyceps militaris CM01]EGX97130.1 Alkbh6 protein [Cordyceps militaris CM01]